MTKPVLFTTLQDRNFYGTSGDNIDAYGTPIFILNLRKAVKALSDIFFIGAVCSDKAYEIVSSHPIAQDLKFAIKRESSELSQTCKQVIEHSEKETDTFIWFNARNLNLDMSAMRSVFIEFIDSNKNCMLSASTEQVLMLDGSNISVDIENNSRLVFERSELRTRARYNKGFFGFKNNYYCITKKGFKIDNCYTPTVPSPIFPEDLPAHITGQVINSLMIENVEQT